MSRIKNVFKAVKNTAAKAVKAVVEHVTGEDVAKQVELETKQRYFDNEHAGKYWFINVAGRRGTKN